MQRVVQRAEGAPDLEESTTYAPYYGFRYEFRLPRYDPTSIVSLTIETVDTSSGEIAFLGYAFFPLFLHKKTKDPVTDNSEQIYIFNEGWYQIPIYHQRPPVTPPFTWDLIQDLERIPCATLLI